MKQTVQLRDFLNFRFLFFSLWDPSGRRCVFTVSRCCEEDNRYEKRIWCSDRQGLRELVEGRGFLAWLDSTRFLCKEPRGAQDRGPYTKISCFDMENSRLTDFCELPLDVEEVRVLDERRLVIKSQCQRKMFGYCGWDAGDRARALEKNARNENVIVLDEFPYCENGTGITNGLRRGLFLWENGTTAPLTPSTMEVGAWDLSDDGKRLILIGQDYDTERPITSRIYEVDLERRACRAVYGGDRYKISRIWYLNDQITFTATDGTRLGMMENDCFYTLKDGEPHLELDFDRSLRMNVGSDSRYGKAEVVRKYNQKLYMGVTERNSTHLYVYTEGEIAPVYEQEGAIDGFSVGPEGIRMILMRDMELEELYHLDWDGGLVRLSRFNQDWCESHSIARPRKLAVKSGGEEIDGWVLLPVGYDPEKTYPAILDIHGGPKTVYGEVYYHEMQVWAGRGYFVFFCNPHGSDGRGNLFADMRKGYGDQDYRDLMCFTDRVLDQYPQIDPSRVAVTGGSYGGFMTNWIIGHTGRFCCAASQRSISNWITETISDSGHYFAVEQQFSDPKDCAHELWEYSPLRFVNHAVTPTLFIHSDEDYRCPLPEALQMYSALLNQGVPSRMCIFKGENHSLSRSGRPKNRIRRLEEITAWIDRYCKGEEGTWEWN